jgi:hypothetical protein
MSEHFLPIDHLNEEDLERWREVSAYRKLVDLGHPEITLEKAVNIYREHDRLLCDLIGRYEIEPGACPLISPIDGAILERY